MNVLWVMSPGFFQVIQRNGGNLLSSDGRTQVSWDSSLVTTVTAPDSICTKSRGSHLSPPTWGRSGRGCENAGKEALVAGRSSEPQRHRDRLLSRHNHTKPSVSRQARECVFFP